LLFHFADCRDEDLRLTAQASKQKANILGSNRIAVAQWLNSSKVTAHRSARKYLPIECIFAAFARLADAPLEERIRLWLYIHVERASFCTKMFSARNTPRATNVRQGHLNKLML